MRALRWFRWSWSKLLQPASYWNKSSAISKTSEKARKIPLKPGRAMTVASRGSSGRPEGFNLLEKRAPAPPGDKHLSWPPTIKTNTAAAHLLFQAGRARNVSVQTGLWILRWRWCRCDAALTFSCKCVKKHNEPITADSSLCVYYFRLPQLPDLMSQLTG